LNKIFVSFPSMVVVAQKYNFRANCMTRGLFTVLLIDVLPKLLERHVTIRVAGIFRQASPQFRMADFYKGLIDTGHIAYFIAVIVWFLMLATVVLQSRRWR